MSEAAVIRIFESELEQIKRCVVDRSDIETGGELIGLWSHADSPTVLLAGVTIMLAGTPGPGSHQATTSFEQDPSTHMELERLTWEQFGMQVVGLWHSHHRLSLHNLSQGDRQRTQQYSIRHRRPRYSEILAYLMPGEPSRQNQQEVVGIKPHVYADASTGKAVTTSLQVLPGMSPLRQALRQSHLPPGVTQVLEGPHRVRGPVPAHVFQDYPGLVPGPAPVPDDPTPAPDQEPEHREHGRWSRGGRERRANEAARSAPWSPRELLKDALDCLPQGRRLPKLTLSEEGDVIQVRVDSTLAIQFTLDLAGNSPEDAAVEAKVYTFNKQQELGSVETIALHQGNITSKWLAELLMDGFHRAGYRDL